MSNAHATVVINLDLQHFWFQGQMQSCFDNSHTLHVGRLDKHYQLGPLSLTFTINISGFMVKCKVVTSRSIVRILLANVDKALKM